MHLEGFELRIYQKQEAHGPYCSPEKPVQINQLIRGRRKTFSLFWGLNSPYFWNLESSSPNDALCQVWLKLVQWFCRRFLNLVNVYPIFWYYFPLEKDIVLHLNKFESSSPKKLCAKFGWKWFSVSWEFLQ